MLSDNPTVQQIEAEIKRVDADADEIIKRVRKARRERIRHLKAYLRVVDDTINAQLATAGLERPDTAGEEAA